MHAAASNHRRCCCFFTVACMLLLPCKHACCFFHASQQSTTHKATVHNVNVAFFHATNQTILIKIRPQLNSSQRAFHKHSSHFTCTKLFINQFTVQSSQFYTNQFTVHMFYTIHSSQTQLTDQVQSANNERLQRTIIQPNSDRFTKRIHHFCIFP